MREAGRQTFHRGNDRIFGGVCSGLAEGFHIDSLWIRLAFVVLAFVQGLGVLIYIVLWLVMPEDTESGTRSGFDSVADDVRRAGREFRAQFGGPSGAAAPPTGIGSQTVVLGVVLVILGALVLGVNTGLFTWGLIWPVAVIALGIVLLLRGLGRRR